MKRRIVAAAILLAACTPKDQGIVSPGTNAPPAEPGLITVVADKVVVKGTQALIIANLVYQSVGTPVAVALEQNVLPQPVEDQVKALDRTVIAALVAGRNAQEDAGKAREAAKALDGLAMMSRLTGIKLPQF